ncbi:DUF3941 domain-containing protein [Alkalihalobacillus pseudalcaliphilus]|nr:DUF3941 domain-containing protein [Alkalihalobacillus pseudalcaliphilus]
MSQTRDNNKKPKDHNAYNQLKNEQEKKNARAGKHNNSKKTDHL